jgi:hypothetical protein
MTTALVPALQSNWLVMHVTVMMLKALYWLLISNLLFNRCFFSPRKFSSNGKYEREKFKPELTSNRITFNK